MRWYEFHSRLTPEQVFARLDACAKPKDITAFGNRAFWSQRKKDGFCLGYTGTLPVRGFLPFRGEVRTEQGGSVISGGFSVRAVWVLMAALFILFCLVALAFGVPPITAIVMTALWALLCFAYYTGIQTVFFKKRQQAVLEFIQKHLLD